LTVNNPCSFLLQRPLNEATQLLTQQTCAASMGHRVVLFHALFALVHCANSRGLSARLRTRVGKKMKAKDGAVWTELFQAPEMLLISSPMERKVSYTQLKNFKSVGGTVLPLLDAGLVAPYGIAWDAPRNALYICDGSLRKIFRVVLKAFKCKRQCKGLDIQLRTDGNRYTVVEGVIAQWASVDANGNLVFTDQETNSVNKLTVDVIDKITKGKVLPKDLGKVTEAEAAGEEAAKESTEALVGEKPNKPAVATPAPPAIFQLYQKKVCPHVGTPAGIVAEGDRLYWTNQIGGFTSGTVAEGKTNPKVKGPAKGDNQDAPSFPSFKIATQKSAYGICLTTSKVLFTDTTHNVWATSRGTRETLALTSSLLKPRGIVWDGDNTAYVADQEGNFIVSMPVGLLKENAPVSRVLDIHGPFGIALMKTSDPIWDPLKEEFAGARGIAGSSSFVMLVVGAALAITMG